MAVLNKMIVKTERLFEQKIRVRRIRTLQRQIELIDMELQGPKAMKLSDMPKSQNPFDRTTHLLSDKLDLENEMNRNIKNYKDEDVILNGVIDRIATLPESLYGQPNSIYQTILRYRYLDDCSMKEINKRLNSYREDFEDREESLLRNLYEWNKKALRLFKKCQN